jgi:hypothetical protein
MSDKGHERLVVVSDAPQERYGIPAPTLEPLGGGHGRPVLRCGRVVLGLDPRLRESHNEHAQPRLGG